MAQLTSQWQQKVNDLAWKYNVSTDAVLNLLQAVQNGNGTMAQFYHSELGGGGQWMQGGMTMVGDMFNNGLKATVDGLCMELSQFMFNQPNIYVKSSRPQSPGSSQQQQQGGYGNFNTGNWWPSHLGSPTMTGSQNNTRYAYFANIKRLVTEANGRINIYNTLDHQIGGVSQQQGSNLSVAFTSQYGTVNLLNLPLVSSDDMGTVSNTTDGKLLKNTTSNVQNPFISSDDMATVSNTTDNLQTERNPYQDNSRLQTNLSSPTSVKESDIFATLERLDQLKQKNILTEAEFLAKKNELLSRL